MRSLILVRHAKAVTDAIGLTDFERPLNERGLREAPVMARRLAQAANAPLQLLSSPALRALTTAKIFESELGAIAGALRLEPAIYEASADTLLGVARSLDDAQPTAAIFGHNPGLSDFCHQLARCEFDEMPTCAVVHIDFSVERWGELAPGSGRVIDYSFPKERQ